MKLMRVMGKGKRVWSLVTLGVMVALLLLPLTLVFAPVPAFAQEAAAEGCEAGKGKDWRLVVPYSSMWRRAMGA